MLVGKRRRMLRYLERTDLERYRSLVSELGLRFIYAVLFLSALSFLGLGVQPPSADWGGMVKENKDGIVFGSPAALIPAAAIAALAISVNLVADWILNRTTDLKGGRGNA